jgi:hypothetical protein
VRIDDFACFQRSSEERSRGAQILGRVKDDMVADSEGSGICVATSGLGAQKPRNVAGAAGSVAWEAHVGWSLMDYRVTRLRYRKQNARGWSKKVARLSCRSPDGRQGSCFPMLARVSQADPCGGAKRGVRPSHRLGSRVHSALHLTIWSGSVSVVLERRAWRMLIQEDNILPDD